MYLLYDLLNRENFSKYIKEPEGYIRYCRVTPVETITQHTSRMASNDTTRCGYKLGLYDNEKKNLYEC